MDSNRSAEEVAKEPMNIRAAKKDTNRMLKRSPVKTLPLVIFSSSTRRAASSARCSAIDLGGLGLTTTMVAGGGVEERQVGRGRGGGVEGQREGGGGEGRGRRWEGSTGEC